MDGSKIFRGDLVAVALPGAYGKPRPALVIQSDVFDVHPSVTILPLTSELQPTADPAIPNYRETNSGKWAAKAMSGDGGQSPHCAA